MATWMDNTKFVSNLKSLVRSNGMTGRDLAAALETTPATVSRYLTGQRAPELEYVFRAAKYFNVSIDWLLGITDDKFDVLSPENRNIVNLYSRASQDDKVVIQTVLRKYEDK